jgi:transcriptional regulator with XRE-family HTH domain
MMKGLSQDKLAEALGLTFQQVQKYEKGVNRIGASRLFEIARVLQVPVQFFYDDFERAPDELLALEDPGVEEAAERRDFLSALATPEGMQLCRHFANVKNHAVRRRIVDLVRALAEEGGGDDESE